MKTFICAFCLCLFSLFLFSTLSSAQEASSEPPLVAADLAIFQSVIKNTVAAGDDESKLSNVYKDAATANHSTEAHAIYVITKISIIQSILADPDSKDSIIENLSGSLVPNDSEIELVKDNQDELSSIEAH
jgi:ABC-type Zn uptake system ZnuABC Zn-binding protein ZnuA